MSFCSHEKIKVIWQEPPYRIVRCLNCGQVLQRPVPIDPLSLYSDKYFTDNYLRFQVERMNYWRRRWQDLSKLIPVPGCLLDIGCGVGLFLKVARDLGWQAEGVDPAPFARAYAQEQDLQVWNDLAVVPYRENYYDLVTAWDVLAHVPAPGTVIEQAHQLLKNGGWLVVKTPYWNLAVFHFVSALSKLVKTSFFLHVPQQLYFFQPETLKKLVSDAGFKDIKIVFVPEARFDGVRYSHSAFKHAIIGIFKKIIAAIKGKESFLLLARKEV